LEKFMSRERWASLISGSGSTMERMVVSTRWDGVEVDAGLVVASNPRAAGIERARRQGVPVKVIDPNEFKRYGEHSKEVFGEKLLEVLDDHKITVVTQNGWRPTTPENVIDQYQGRIFNQHPGPIPEFGGRGMYGMRVHAAVWLFRHLNNRHKAAPEDLWTEVVAHRVGYELDDGAVVKSCRVPILPQDSYEDLQKRALPVEHEVQIALLRDIAAGTVREVPAREPILKPGQENDLKFAKLMAGKYCPRG
jgi:phosphoribosylglycinamide formyltransferase-1